MQKNWNCLLTTKHRSYSILRSCTRLGRTHHSPHASAVYSTPHGDDNSKYPVDHSGQMISPLSTPPPPKQESSTAAGCVEIMNFTKCKVLPNPDSESLMDCDDNSATRMLAAAIYCQLEKNYFDETCSRSDVTALFCCNTSQLSKGYYGGRL